MVMPNTDPTSLPPSKNILTKAHSSPERTFPKPVKDRPGFISNTQGTAWGGMMPGDEIVQNGGTTYGDTSIDLENADTQARIGRAKATLNKKSFYEISVYEQAFLMDQFAQRIHQDDVVGPYFPAVLRVQAAQKKLMDEGTSRVLSIAQNQAIQELINAQMAHNTLLWARRDQDNVVRNESVTEVEGNNTQTGMAVLQIQKEAAYDVLGGAKASEIEAQATKGVENLSAVDLESRVVSHLMEEAGKAKLTSEERTKLTTLKSEEDRLWDEKHKSQSDFADAIRDSNPDCSEYANLTAVSLAQSGIKNMNVQGHVLQDGDFPHVGAHAYNVILDKDGQNIVGVFEGTATSGTFKKVMNPVSLTDFQNGATLVTHNDQSGWSTYGTGAPAQGSDLMAFVDDPDRPGQQDLVSNIIERRDTNAMAKAKMEYVQSLKPGAVADQIIGIYTQYGEAVKVQGWIDDIRDSKNPAFAQAAQILQDYKGHMPPPDKIRNRIVEIVQNSQERAIASQDYNLAITPEVLQELAEPAAASLAADLKTKIDTLKNLPEAELKALSADKPWVSEVMDISRRIGSVPYGDFEDGKSAFAYAEEGNTSYLDAYKQLETIVQHHHITPADLQELRQENHVAAGPSHKQKLSMTS